MLRLLLFPTAAGLFVACGPSALAQGRMERILSSFGYVIKKSSPAQPTAWENEQFQTLAKRTVEIKSAKAVPGSLNTFYRFSVIEERYVDARSAGKRLTRLGEKPPGMSPEENKAFPLRTAFQHGESVYIVSTDVSMFSGEMSRIAKRLEAALRRRRD
ncbi:MAG TPA: hypothetical protein VIQ24_16795 [Pyrinomonadaceae bacterium]